MHRVTAQKIPYILTYSLSSTGSRAHTYPSTWTVSSSHTRPSNRNDSITVTDGVVDQMRGDFLSRCIVSGGPVRGSDRKVKSSRVSSGKGSWKTTRRISVWKNFRGRAWEHTSKECERRWQILVGWLVKFWYEREVLSDIWASWIIDLQYVVVSREDE